MDSSVFNSIDELLQRYAKVLDRKDMRGWLACFGEDGTYLCQSWENYTEGLPVGFMLDDCHARLRDRVKAVDEVWAGTAEDYQPRHLCQRLSCEADEQGGYQVVSNFVVFYTTNRGDSQVLATGEYLDRVRVVDGVASLVSRKAILDQDVAPRYLVYPI
ncbi:MAG: nuclear transport factor 2 family protein [Pseudomonas sp.]|nr:nuclear transport factor 2 family protein [Pseudomonas sp.]